MRVPAKTRASAASNSVLQTLLSRHSRPTKRIMCGLVMFTNADGTVQPALCFRDLEDDGTIAVSPTLGRIRTSYPRSEAPG
jgi:hypothetical protein